MLTSLGDSSPEQPLSVEGATRYLKTVDHPDLTLQREPDFGPGATRHGESSPIQSA